MADLFEDPYPADQEFLSCIDSGHVSDEEDESDYEARLYSLIHYSDAALAGDDTSDPVVYECKRNKVSRLDEVKSIIGAKEPQSKSKVCTDPTDLRKLLESYKKATSKFSHSTPKREGYQKTSAGNRERSQSVVIDLVDDDEDGIDKHFLEPEADSLSECFNATSPDVTTSHNTAYSDGLNSKNKISSVSETSQCSTQSESLKNNTESEVIVHRNSQVKGDTWKNIKTYKGKKCTSRADEDQTPSRQKLHHKQIQLDTPLRINEDKDNSKYNFELRKDKANISVPSLIENNKEPSGEKEDTEGEIIVLFDSSDDSDHSSVVEVEPPVKELPPVLTLSSGDERKELENNMSEDDDIVVVYSCENTVSKKASGSGGLRAEASVKKSKKKKSRKLHSSRMYAHSDVNPTSWTKNMCRFYNESWGGEDFDVAKLQLSMSGKRSKWSVLYSDTVPSQRNNSKRNFKCNNCNAFGHPARMCPEPQKPNVCLFCGVTGHLGTNCPTPICLCCGNTTLKYNFGCPKCSSDASANRFCNKCHLTGHHPSECPDVWRKYHSTTTEEDMASTSEAIYKPRDQQFCSNCAARGHQYHECRQSMKQGNWMKRANSYSPENSGQAKRRKLEMKDQKYKRSPNSLLHLFKPLYQKYIH